MYVYPDLRKKAAVELYFDVFVCVYVLAMCVLHGVCVQAV